MPGQFTMSIDKAVGQLGWRPVAEPVAWQRVSTAYAWGFTVLVALLLVPATIQTAVDPLIGLALCALIIAAIASRWLAWRRYRYALDGDRLLVRSGWWKRRTIILPYASIQSVDVVESIVSRRFGTASLTIGVASGRGFCSHGVPALRRDTARALREQLLAPFAARV